MNVIDNNGLSNEKIYEVSKKIQKNKKIFFYDNIFFNDEPKIPLYSSKFKFLNIEEDSSGISLNEKKAFISTIVECVERISNGNYKKTNFIFKSYNNLIQKKEINIYKFDIKKDINKKIYWTKCYSIFDKKNFIIPSQFIFAPFFEENYYLREPTSNGCAAWSSYSGAILNGIYEVVERDAFLLTYLNKIKSKKIDLKNLNSQKIKDLYNYFKRYELDLNVFEITNDFQIPVFVCIILDKKNKDAFSIGANANINKEKAIISCILESYKVRRWVNFELLKNKNKNKKILSSIDRIILWNNKKNMKNIDFLLKTKKLHKINLKYNTDIIADLKKVLKNIKKLKYDIFVKDITINDKNLTQNIIKVVKVVIPQAQPFYLDESFKEKSYNGRTYKFKKNKKFNEFPHPFA